MPSKATDETMISFGKYKGEKLANIPAIYFHWFKLNVKGNHDIKEYIEENKDLLNKELERAGLQQRID